MHLTRPNTRTITYRLADKHFAVSALSVQLCFNMLVMTVLLLSLSDRFTIGEAILPRHHHQRTLSSCNHEHLTPLSSLRTLPPFSGNA